MSWPLEGAREDSNRPHQDRFADGLFIPVSNAERPAHPPGRSGDAESLRDLIRRPGPVQAEAVWQAPRPPHALRQGVRPKRWLHPGDPA